MAQLNWKPVEILASVSNSIGPASKAAGFENAKGIRTAGYLKDPTDPRWQNDLAVKTREAVTIRSEDEKSAESADEDNLYHELMTQGS
jgi:hypothetical protein